MFKNSSDELNFIARTGSHATKPKRNGRIDDIPEWAQKPEEYYNSIRDQYLSLATQLRDTQDKLADINAKLRFSLPHKEYQHLAQYKERLGDRVRILQEQANMFRPMARAAGEQAWATVFFCIAKKLLTPDDFRILSDETKAFLGHDEFEVKSGMGMKTEEVRENERQSKKRRERRVNWRKHQGGMVTVWKNNKAVND